MTHHDQGPAQGNALGRWAAHMVHNGHLLGLAAALILIAGLSAWGNLPRIEDPRITTRNALVVTPLPGGDAARVESLVTKKLEDALREVAEIKTLESTSRAGVSLISVELDDAIEADENQAVFSKIRDRLAEAQAELPPEAGRPELDDLRGAVAYSLIAAVAWKGEGEPPHGDPGPALAGACRPAAQPPGHRAVGSLRGRGRGDSRGGGPGRPGGPGPQPGRRGRAPRRRGPQAPGRDPEAGGAPHPARGGRVLRGRRPGGRRAPGRRRRPAGERRRPGPGDQDLDRPAAGDRLRRRAPRRADRGAHPPGRQPGRVGGPGARPGGRVRPRGGKQTSPSR